MEAETTQVALLCKVLTEDALIGFRKLCLKRSMGDSCSPIAFALQEQADQLDALGSKLLTFEVGEESIDLFAHSEESCLKRCLKCLKFSISSCNYEVSFHKAAERALHQQSQHRVLYLHSTEAGNCVGAALLQILSLEGCWASMR